MSRKYKFKDHDKLYFITFTAINLIDVIIRNNIKRSSFKVFNTAGNIKGFNYMPAAL